MRKRKKGRKFGREKNQRIALMRSLTSSFLLKEKIETTEAKAKTLASFVEKEITKARKNSIHSRRLLAKNFSPKIVKKLITDIGPRYKERKGGYARIIKLGPRKSDGAKMAIIELIKF